MIETIIRKAVSDLIKKSSGHDYIWREGSKGNYRYWYRTSSGKMVTGKKPVKAKKNKQKKDDSVVGSVKVSDILTTEKTTDVKRYSGMGEHGAKIGSRASIYFADGKKRKLSYSSKYKKDLEDYELVKNTKTAFSFVSIRVTHNTNTGWKSDRFASWHQSEKLARKPKSGTGFREEIVEVNEVYAE